MVSMLKIASIAPTNGWIFLPVISGLDYACKYLHVTGLSPVTWLFV